jgi:signal transduction histidine kinase
MAKRAVAEIEVRWQAWLLDRNRRGTRLSLWIGLTLYPLFGALDYLIAPRRWLWALYGTRVVFTAVTLGMFRVVRRPIFEAHPDALSSAYLLLASLGLTTMTVILGGLSSPYYAGLALVMVASGLLFVWPTRVVVFTHGAIIGSFVAANLAFGHTARPVDALSNLFFLVSTGIIVGTGQVLAYRAHHRQVNAQLALERTKGNLEQAHEQLKQLDRFKSQFFANITHELKTPLAMILAPLELMLDGAPDSTTLEAARSTLEAMFRSGVKLLKLIADLLDLSKLEESRLRLRVDEHDLVGYLRGLLSQVQPLAQRKGITLHFAANAETSLAHCDLERIERVFINLLSNAMKFTPGGGNVWLTLRDAEGSVEVEVKDDGPGFPAEVNERVFERFFQVDMAASRKFGGTGIGLALAKELVELHGGRISASGVPGEGATFTVELQKDRAHFGAAVIDRRVQPRDLPFGQREADRGLTEWTTQLSGREEFRLLEIDEATEQRIAPRDPEDHNRSRSILVVEDMPDIVRVIHLALRDHFRIIAASDGKKGIELAMRESPSLIITDLMMPEMDGLELTRRLRADARTRYVPVVMLTARADLEDRLAGLDSGANAYLGKPFSPRELLSTVLSLLGTQEATADALLNQRLDSLEVVTGALAHEINNPLNYLKGSLDVVSSRLEELFRLAGAANGAPAEAAETSALVTSTRKLLDVAESGIRRIGATVALMRRYSREGYARVLQPYDAFAAARDVMRVVRPATVSAAEIETSFEGDGIIECVPEEINQVLSNLIQNALEAAPDGAGRIRVRGRREGGFVTLSVADNGPGIGPEDQAKIFTPFFSTKDPGKGMGMGLTIARRVVTSLGGTLRVKSQRGSGAEFVVRIPCGQREDATQSTPEEEEEQSPITLGSRLDQDRAELDGAAGNGGNAGRAAADPPPEEGV